MNMCIYIVITCMVRYFHNYMHMYAYILHTSSHNALYFPVEAGIVRPMIGQQNIAQHMKWKDAEGPSTTCFNLNGQNLHS